MWRPGDRNGALPVGEEQSDIEQAKAADRSADDGVFSAESCRQDRGHGSERDHPHSIGQPVASRTMATEEADREIDETDETTNPEDIARALPIKGTAAITVIADVVIALHKGPSVDLPPGPRPKNLLKS